MMSTVGRKFSFLEAATTAEHVALLGHSARKWMTVSDFPVSWRHAIILPVPKAGVWQAASTDIHP